MFTVKSSKNVSKEFNAIMDNLPKEKHNQIWFFITNTPNGHRDHKMKFKKIRNCRQYDITEGHRLIYKVDKKEKLVVLGYIGNHDGAKIYLRNNC